MYCRGVRGATTVTANDAKAILAATRELLSAMVECNSIQVCDLGSITFTMTRDLDAAFPAKAARQLGWQFVPLLDAQEIPVPGSLPRCIRVLMHWNTETAQEQIKHVYLRGAQILRPDFTAQDGGSK